MKLLDAQRRAPGMSRWRLLIAWGVIAPAVGVLLSLLFRLRPSGREHLPRRGPLIYVSNHQSHFDPVLVAITVLDRPCAFLARASLFRFRPFGALIRFLNSIPLERERGGSSALRSALGELAAGRCVLIFPEGTRTRDGRLGRFKSGVVLLARRSGATIVPIAIEGAYDAWPRSRTLPRLTGRIAMRLGPPVSAEAFREGDGAAALDAVRATIDRLRLELRRELRRAGDGRLPAAGPGDGPSDR